MRTVFGCKESFAIVVGPPAWPIRTVEVWVCGENFSSFDSSAYLPSFASAVEDTGNWLQRQLNFLKHEKHFFDLGVEEAFSLVASEELPELWTELRLLDWGPTTDAYLCFLLPIRERLFLTCRCNESGLTKGVQVFPYELINTLSSASRELSRREPQTPINA